MKEMFDEKLPKYYLVKKAIVENIDNEVYDSKEPIPSERELMETYQVSRITIRKRLMNWSQKDICTKSRKRNLCKDG